LLNFIWMKNERLSEILNEKLRAIRGSFTIEAVIIFWLIFSIVLFAFGIMTWQFQKHAIASLVSKHIMTESQPDLLSSDPNVLVVKSEADELRIETTLPRFGFEGEMKETIYRKSEEINFKYRLAWLSFLSGTFEKVMNDE